MSGTNDNNDVLYLHITPSGKKYFGVTCKRPERRWANGHGYKSNPHFWRAIEKYGWNNITHVILADGLTPDEADSLEIFFIALYDTINPSKGYNQDRGGRGKNKRMSEETKQKIGEAQKGKIISEEQRQKISKAHKGKTLSEEHKRKISKAHKGIGHSEESKRKISEAHKGTIFSEETKRKMSEAQKGKTGKQCPNSKTVICLTTKEIFYGTKEAGRITGIGQSHISNVCNGKEKSAGKLPDGTKLKWKYVKDLPKPRVSEETKQLLSNGPKLLKSA